MIAIKISEVQGVLDICQTCKRFMALTCDFDLLTFQCDAVTECQFYEATEPTEEQT